MIHNYIALSSSLFQQSIFRILSSQDLDCGEIFIRISMLIRIVLFKFTEVPSGYVNEQLSGLNNTFTNVRL